MGTEIDLTLPKLSIIRIYSSLGSLVTHNGNNSNNQLSAPDVEDLNDPNFNTMFDSLETTWEYQNPVPGHPEITTNFGPNLTEVDLFGLVQQFTVEGLVPPHLCTGRCELGLPLDSPTPRPLEYAPELWSAVEQSDRGEERGTGTGNLAQARHSRYHSSVERPFPHRPTVRLHQQRFFAIHELTATDGDGQCRGRRRSRLPESPNYYLQLHRVDGRRLGTRLLGCD
jgi:hypothetical protein